MTSPIDNNAPLCRSIGSSYTRDGLVRLLVSMVDVAHEPKRMTDHELGQTLHAWNELLTFAADIHQAHPAFFGFHQGLISEFDSRHSLAVLLGADEDLGDFGDWVSDGELVGAVLGEAA